MKCFVTSLGCPKNTIDTETLLGALSNAFSGMELVSEADNADVLIVNTCSFIESAVSESIDVILELAQNKKSHQKLMAFGCLAGRYGEEGLSKELPEVDVFAGPEEFDKAILRLSVLMSSSKPPSLFSADRERYNILPPWRSYLKISEGCSNHCTYCIIPNIRGRQRCRKPDEIVAEARKLVSNGAIEVTLVAQDLTAYEWEGLKLEGLLDLLAGDLGGGARIAWLRLLYLNIGRISADLLNVISVHPNICPYLDIPIQHASDSILKRMGRGYDRGVLDEKLAMTRQILPDFALRTTVMLGLPGETDEDVEELCAFLERWQFDHLGAFVYSDEQECAAHRFGEKIPARTAKSRLRKVMKIQERISKRKSKALIGQTIDVLVEGASHETAHLMVGRAAFQAPDIDGCVYINDGKPLVGRINKVKITDAHVHDLVGEVL